MDPAELLRRLTINDVRVDDGRGLEPTVLSARERALVRLAAAVAVGAACPTFGAEIDTAVEAGVDASEVADVLAAVAPVVGLPSVVAAAPRVALGLGLEPIDGWGDAEGQGAGADRSGHRGLPPSG